MVSFGQKLKMPKTCEKPFYKNIGIVLRKTPLRKTPNILQEHNSCSLQKTARENTKYSRNETILKSGHLAKAIAHAIAFAKWSVWVKN